MRTKKKYLSEMLPRKVKGEKCCALDDKGERCKNKAIVECYYFGDMESERVDWVRVTFCENHATEKGTLETILKER